MPKILNDSFSVKDEIINAKHMPTLWAKTRVIGGYGLHKDRLGISQLNEVVFETENLVPLIGVQYAMESIFGVKGSINIPTINEHPYNNTEMPTIGSTKIFTPTGNLPYAYGQKVCLFGVGTGGAAENNITALDVRYNEIGINTISYPNNMIPFRYTNDSLAATDVNKYYGKAQVNGVTAYYLKAFESDPEIFHVVKNTDEDNIEENLISSDYFKSDTSVSVESFAQITLAISKKDVREWFTAQGNTEVPRVNSIALFTAIYDSDAKDYAQIQMFSKLNIPTETLSLKKDMNILYRVYGA